MNTELIHINRYGIKRKFELISENKMIFSGESNFLRFGKTDSNIDFVDFEGGPFLSINSEINFKNDKYKIVEIINPNEKDKLYKNELICEIHLKVKKL